jgi:hypothetical protein
MNTTAGTDARCSAAASPAVSFSLSRHDLERDTRRARALPFGAPPPPPGVSCLHRPTDRPPRPFLHHPSRDVRGDDGYDARKDDDDDFSDLQRLISLARLPYCRVTKTFGAGGSTLFIGTSTTTSNATLATAATSSPTTTTKTTTARDSENLPPPSGVHVPKGDEAPRPRKRRTLDHSPVVAARNHHHRRALRQWRPALARSKYPRLDAAPCHRNGNERFGLGKDDNNDDSSNGGGGVSVGTGPLPVQPLLPGEAGVVAAVAAAAAAAEPPSPALAAAGGVATAAAAAISADRGLVEERTRGGGGGARQSNNEENREFVKANFDPIRGSEGGFSHACRVCSQQVVCRKNKAVEDLLRHAMTRSCLLRRARRLRGSHGAAGAPAPGSVVRGALREFFGRHYHDCDEPESPEMGAAAAGAAAQVTSTSTCRHCSAAVSSRGSQGLFVHLAGCVGVASVVNDAADTFRRALLLVASSASVTSSKSTCTNVAPLKANGGIDDLERHHWTPNSNTGPSKLSCPDDDQELDPPFEAGCVPGDGSNAGTPVSSPSGKSPTLTAGDIGADNASFESDLLPADATRSTPINGRPRNPAWDEGVPIRSDATMDPPHPIGRRARFEILKGNEQFVALNFAPPAVSSSRLYTCRVCDQDVTRRNSGCLLKHANTCACLVRRVERRMLSAGDDAATMSFASVASRFVTDALTRYRREHITPPAPDFAGVWTCRRCNLGIIGTRAQRCFRHASECIGIEPALLDLERVLQAIATSSGLVEPVIGSEEQEEMWSIARRPIDAPSPPPPSSRPRGEVLEENKVFVATNFASAETSGRMACKICGQRFTNGDMSSYLRHAVSRSCLLRRADRRARPVAEAGGESEAGQRIPRVSIIELDTGAVAGAFQGYRGRHFRAAGADGCLDCWECRLCGEHVLGSGNQPILYHLIHCIGIVSVIRHLERINPLM